MARLPEGRAVPPAAATAPPGRPRTERTSIRARRAPPTASTRSTRGVGSRCDCSTSRSSAAGIRARHARANAAPGSASSSALHTKHRRASPVCSSRTAGSRPITNGAANNSSGNARTKIVSMSAYTPPCSINASRRMKSAWCAYGACWDMTRRVVGCEHFLHGVHLDEREVRPDPFPPFPGGGVLVVKIDRLRLEHSAARFDRRVVQEVKRLALPFKPEYEVRDARDHATAQMLGSRRARL